MSQRGWYIKQEESSGNSTFNLVNSWDALEPYVINDEFGMSRFEEAGSIMIIDRKQIIEDKINNNEHYKIHKELLEQITMLGKYDYIMFVMV